MWLMRQAGRFLPEYRELRKKHSLWQLFHEPELAAQVTLMPLKRFALDAAIVFSDILLVAEALGFRVHYPEGGNPSSKRNRAILPNHSTTWRRRFAFSKRSSRCR